MTNPVKIPGGVSVRREDDAVVNLNPETEVSSNGPVNSAVEPTLFQAVQDRIDDVSIYQGFVRGRRLDQASERGVPLNAGPEEIYDRLERAGIAEYMTPEDFESFADVSTTAEFDLKVQYLTERMMSQQQLQDKGFLKSLIGEALAYSADPITLSIDALAGGTGKGRLLHRFLSGGARAAVANGMVEALLLADERAYRPQDIGFAMAAAFGMGGVFGAALGPRADMPSVRVDRSVPLDKKSPDLPARADSPMPPRTIFEDAQPVSAKVDDDVEKLVAPDDVDTVSTGGRVVSDDPSVPTPVNVRAPVTQNGDLEQLVVPEGVEKYVPETDGVDPKLTERASRRLSDDELFEVRDEVERLSVIENPTNPQMTRLDKLTQKLDDHDDAIKAAKELDQAKAKVSAKSRTEALVAKNFEGLDYVTESIRLHEEGLKSASRDAEVADVFVDPGRSNGVGADIVEGAEIMNDTAYGFQRDVADELVASLAPDMVAGDVSVASQLFRKMTPATAARVIKNVHTRVLASRMFTHPWLRKGEDVNQTGWEDKARRRFMGPETVRLMKHRQAFNEWFADIKKERNLITGPSFLQFKLQKEFAQLVGSTMQSLNSGRTPSVHPGVMKAAKAADEFMKQHWGQLQRSGVVPEDMPPPKDFYISQIVDRTATRQFVNTFSTFDQGLDALTALFRKGLNVRLRAQVVDLIEAAGDADANQELIDNLTESLTDVISRAMARRAYSHDLSAVGMEDVDAFGIHLGNVEDLKKLLQDNLVNRADEGTDTDAVQAEIDSVIASLTRAQSKRRQDPLPDRLRRRVDLDMDAELTYVNARGETKTVRLGDLYERDINHTAHNYGRWAAAEATLAEDGSSIAKLRQAIDELKEESRDIEVNPDAPTKDDIRLLEYGFRAVLNLPAHDVPENYMRASNALKNLAYASKMGAAFLHSMSEAYTIAAQMGVGKTLREFPTLLKIIDSYRKGQIDPGLHEELYAMNGAVFNSLEVSLGGSRFDTDLSSPSSNKALQMLETGAEGAKRTLSYVNLLPVTTDIMRQFGTVMQLKQLDDALTGKKMPSFWDGIRRQYGLSDESMDALRAHFNSNKVTRKADGSLDWDGSIGLDEMPPKTRLALEDFLYRSTTTMIQEVHRGNLPMLMTGPVGSIILQFRSFEVASTTRHLAADISRGDVLALNKFVGSALLASLGYASRVYMYSGGDEDVIEERLAPDRVIMNGIAYSVSAGAVPALVDTVSYQLTGGFTPFNRFRTTGMSDNLNPLETFGVGSAPVVSVFQDALRAGTIPIQAGWDMAAGEDPTISREQMKALYTVIGADTLWFLRPLKEYQLAQMPKERELNRGNILTATGLDE